MSIGFETVIFLFGGFLLLIGLVGGDMSYQGFKVPKVGTLPRFTTTAAGGVIMLGKPHSVGGRLADCRGTRARGSAASVE